MNCQEFEELSGAYALDALTPEERQTADVHLMECPKCQHTLQELQSVVNLLPLSVPMVEPSPLLKERLLSEIKISETYKATSPTNIKQARKLKPSLSWHTMQFVAVAAALMLCLLGAMTAWNISLQRQITYLSAQTPISYTIQGVPTEPGVTGQLTYLPALHMTTLVVQGLPSLVGAQVYQGWLLQNGQPKSIGLLNVENGTATLDFQGNVTGYDATAVSMEPGPQASLNTPKGQIIATGTLKKTQALINT